MPSPVSVTTKRSARDRVRTVVVFDALDGAREQELLVDHERGVRREDDLVIGK